MSSDKDLVSKNAKFTLQRTSHRQRKAHTTHLWRQETPQRSTSRPRITSDRKIRKMDKVRHTVGSDLKKMKEGLIERPSPPHNTTQYLIYANHGGSEAPNLYAEHDRLKFDFEHHAMMGSMMDVMANKLTEIEGKLSEKRQGDTGKMMEECRERSVEERKSLEENGSWLKSVNSVNSGLDTDLCYNISDRDQKESDPYSHYLRRAEVGEDLDGLVRQLVTVLDKKDQQIGLLKLRGQVEKR